MTIQDVEALAKRCKVSMRAACAESGVAGSTVWRWKNGDEADCDKLAALRTAIVVIAGMAGTLPADIPPQPVPRRSVRQIVKDINRSTRELAERAGE